ITLTWLSHASWLIETKSHKILLDPFFEGNPKAKHTAADFADVSYVIVSHGHADHTGDVAAVLEKSNAQLIANYEIAEWYGKHHGISNSVGMNIGGSYGITDGTLKMVPAIHSSSLPDGSYAGMPAGFVLRVADRSTYFACDTAFYSDMRYYAGRVDVAIVPIGDLFTMGVHDSVEAIKQIAPRIALPSHYDTWPPIEQDAEHWATLIRSETDTRPVVLSIGEAFQL
ncbi:MAG: metal-dependent hydrolase, partial [Planctomycetota bacterium]